MASFIMMSVQSPTFNILKNQVSMTFLALFFCNTVAFCDLKLLCKDWDGLPCTLALNKFLINLATFGVEMSQVFGKGSHLFNASVFGHYSLVLFVPKIYSPFAAGGVCKEVLPVPLNLSVFFQRRYWTLFRYFHSWSTGGWLQFSDLGLS